MIKLKKKSVIHKDKKITIKIMKIKIEMQNKFYIWLKGKIESKNQISKRTEKINQKSEDQNWQKKWLKGKIEKKISLPKGRKIKRIRTKLLNNIHKFELKNEIENK